MLSRIPHLLGLRPPAPPLPRPERPLCVIGDVHGCAAELARLWARIDRIDGQGGEARIVLLGDLVDRGPDSARVLELVQDRIAQAPDRVTCVMGNHEQMMLEALDSPDAMARWLRHGGRDSLLSLQVPLSGGRQTPEALSGLGAALGAALGPSRVAWLRGLPLYWSADGFVLAHAGGDPDLDPEAQDSSALLWGHRNSRKRPRRDGLFVVHGHWITPEVVFAPGRVSVDTGAYKGHPLSAVWFDGDGPRVLSSEA